MACQMAERIQVRRRRYARIPLTGTVHYTCGPNDRGGACIRVGRYLGPGRHVLLSVKIGTDRDAYAELKGRVAFCRPSEDGKAFVAGVRVFDNAAETGCILSELILEASAQSGQIERTGAEPAHIVEIGRPSAFTVRDDVSGSRGVEEEATASEYTKLQRGGPICG